jgi:hypothetical protein
MAERYIMSDDDKKALTTPQANAVSSYVADDDFADMRPQDRITPRIRLMQGLSPEVAAGKANPGEFAANGMTIIRRNIKAKMIPLMWWLQWVEFNPNLECPPDKKVLGRSVDPNSDLAIKAAKFVEVINSRGKKTFAVTESYNFAVLLPDISGYDTIYTFSLQRSSHKAGKTFLNRLRGMKNPDMTQMPIWSHAFDLYSEFIDKGADKKYFSPIIGEHHEVPEDKHAGLIQMVTGLKAAKAAFLARELERADSDADDHVGDASAAEEPKF